MANPIPETIGDDPLFDTRIAQYDDLAAPMRAMLALDAGRMGSWSWDIVNSTVVGDPFVAKLLNQDFSAQPWDADVISANIHPDDMPSVQASVEHALAGADWYEVEFRDVSPDPLTGLAGGRWLGARGRVTERDADGTALRVIGVNWDATERKTHEASLATLANEMDHRVKNAFAVIRALINVGVRSAASVDDFGDNLRTQVEAMSSAHALSARMARQPQNADASVGIDTIINSALQPWRDGDRVQIDISSGTDFALTSRQVSAVSMLIYELATNAAKYGALGEIGGKLSVVASRTDDGVGHIGWYEFTSAPVSAPQQSDVAGFGEVLIQHCAASLGGSVTRTFRDDGIDVVVTFPIAD